jgi:hypothetical protein
MAMLIMFYFCSLLSTIPSLNFDFAATVHSDSLIDGISICGPDHYICDQSAGIESSFEVYRSYRCRSILCQSRKNKEKSFRINQYAIRSAVRYALTRCMGRTSCCASEKPLHVHRLALPIATAPYGKISDSALSNSAKCTCQISRDSNRSQKSGAFNRRSVLCTMYML